MISTKLATRILTVIIIVGALSIDFCSSTATTTAKTSKDDENNTTVKLNSHETQEYLASSLDSPVSPQPSSLLFTPPYSNEEISERTLTEESLEDAETRLMPNSAEDGILLPYEEDFIGPSGIGARRYPGDYGSSGLPSSVSFPTRPISLRITNGKALEPPFYENDPSKLASSSSIGNEKATFFIRNNCFGVRCTQQQNNGANAQTLINSPEDWKNMYYRKKDIRSKKYEDDKGRDNSIDSTPRFEDNLMESISSNIHSQLAIPFVVVDDNSLRRPQQTFARRSGILDRFSRMTSTTRAPMSTEGWVKLNALSPDAYDPFRFSRNQTANDGGGRQSTFSKRDSYAQASNTFSKRLGVELNPESFADRWGGWSSNGENDNRGGGGGGSRLPAWLEDQLKFGNGNRNSDQGKNWVKLEPIPVAGVSISKWVPKGTQSEDLPTTSWQTNRDRPNGGSPWWDRIDDNNRILTGNGNGNRNRPPQSSPFLRPNGGGDKNRYPDGGWDSKGSSLSSFDRYPTNSWNDIIYPDGPGSATVSWQQSKGGISNYPSSFAPSGGGNGNSGGWSDTRKSMVATGSWSAPQNNNYNNNNNNNNNNNRFPSFINRFNDHRPSSYPTKQATEEDPRWVLISNSRRVTSPSSGHRGNDLLDRSKVLQYINRLHPDLDRRADFPFYEPSPTSHRHGKDFWPFPNKGTSFPDNGVSPNKDDAFHRLNATLSTLTPVLLHRGGTTVRPPIVGTLRPRPYVDEIYDDEASSGSSSNTDIVNSISSTLTPLLSNYVGDGRATSSNAVTFYQSSTNAPIRNFIPGRIRQGLKNINPVYAAVGAGMIPATLAAVMPMMLGKRKRRDVTKLIDRSYYRNYNSPKAFVPLPFGCCVLPKYSR